MLSFFNKKSSLSAAMRFYNSVAFVYAAYDYYTNPNASWDEQGAEMALAALNMLCLRENMNIFEGVASAALNSMGLGAIFRGYTSGSSGVEPVINLVGGAGHLLSAYACLFNNLDAPNEPHIKPG